MISKDLEKEIIQRYPAEIEDYAHSYSHAGRVRDLALYLSKDKKVNIQVLVLSSLLHDIARKIEDEDASTDHSIEGAKLSRVILEKHGYRDDLIDSVCKCVAEHRSDSNPSSLEAKILKDADKLDSIGCVGICRLVASSLQSKKYVRPVFCGKLNMKPGKIKSGMSYLLFKTQTDIKSSFYTKRAKLLAKKRIKDMKYFLDSFLCDSVFFDKEKK